jgi:hypothetical protein
VVLVGFEGDDRVNTTMRARVGRYILKEMDICYIPVGLFGLFDDRYRCVVTVGGD